MSASAPNAPFATYRAQVRFGNLDGLRFLCIAMVLWHHSPPLSQDVLALFGRGFFGVNFFFILSGFLITTLLLREGDRTGRISLKGFYLRRALRILPVYFFVVTCVGAYFIFAKGRSDLLEIWPYYYLFLSSYLLEHIPLLSITWSLAIEEQYYLLWPLVLILVSRRALWLVCLGSIALNVAGAVALFETREIVIGPINIYLPNRAFTPIMMGSLVAIVLHHRRGFQALYKVFSGYWVAPLALLAVLGALQFTPQDVRGVPTLLIHLAMCALLIALVVREDTGLSGFLRIPLVTRLGEISYGMYLYHLIALTIITRAIGGWGPWAVFAAYVPLTVLMAEISFRTLEHWFQRFRP